MVIQLQNLCVFAIFLRTENIPKLFSTDSPENYSEPLDDTSWKPWDIQDDHQCKLGSVWEQP